MKKLFAFILSASMLFALSACGETGDKTPVTTTETLQTSTLTQNSRLSPTESDFERLESVVYGITRSSSHNLLDFGGYFDDYKNDNEFAQLVRNISSPEVYKNAYVHNSLSDRALAEAMYMIWNQKSWGIDSFIDADVEQELYSSYDEDGNPCELPADPMNMFTESFGYIKLNADDVDWILKNVLNVTPDRSKTDDDFDKSGYHGVFNYYYCDGYYYYEVEEGGGGGYGYKVIDCSEQQDGSYIVKLSGYNEVAGMNEMTEELDEDYVYDILEASATLKEIDGKRVWTVSQLRVSEYVVNVDNLDRVEE